MKYSQIFKKIPSQHFVLRKNKFNFSENNVIRVDATKVQWNAYYYECLYGYFIFVITSVVGCLNNERGKKKEEHCS
jgi:hypothetical protein